MPWLIWSIAMKETLYRDFQIISGFAVALWEQGEWHTPESM